MRSSFFRRLYPEISISRAISRSSSRFLVSSSAMFTGSLLGKKCANRRAVAVVTVFERQNPP